MFKTQTHVLDFGSLSQHKHTCSRLTHVVDFGSLLRSMVSYKLRKSEPHPCVELCSARMKQKSKTVAYSEVVNACINELSKVPTCLKGNDSGNLL